MAKIEIDPNHIQKITLQTRNRISIDKLLKKTGLNPEPGDTIEIAILK